jgi:hypothetical protein
MREISFRRGTFRSVHRVGNPVSTEWVALLGEGQSVPGREQIRPIAAGRAGGPGAARTVGPARQPLASSQIPVCAHEWARWPPFRVGAPFASGGRPPARFRTAAEPGRSLHSLGSTTPLVGPAALRPGRPALPSRGARPRRGASGPTRGPNQRIRPSTPRRPPPNRRSKARTPRSPRPIRRRSPRHRRPPGRAALGRVRRGRRPSPYPITSRVARAVAPF